MASACLEKTDYLTQVKRGKNNYRVLAAALSTNDRTRVPEQCW